MDPDFKITQKWGFGMAPIKSEIGIKRELSARRVIVITTQNTREYIQEDLEALSEIKGLFTRSYLQDQWDWFTVWSQLGRPSKKRSRQISLNLKILRLGLETSDALVQDQARSLLQKCNIQVCLGPERNLLDTLVRQS